MKKIILSVLLGTSLGISAAAQAHPGPGGPPPAMKLMHTLRDLSLTDAQQQHVRVLFSDFAAQRQFDQPPHPGSHLNALLAMSEDDLTAEVQQQFDSRQQRAFEMAKLRHEIFSVLDASQREALTERMQHRGQKDKQQRQRRLPSHFDALDLSDAQRTTIASLRQQQAALAGDVEAVMRKFKAAERNLVQSETFTYETWLSTLEEYRTQLLDLALSRARNRYAMLNVLTGQQQQMLLTLVESGKHKKGPRHRRE